MLAIDLYCGLGGWAEGFLAEGYDVIGFDIERHDYGTGGYQGQLVLQDVLTLHGSQFRDAAVIVASPPCTEYSYMAMPWSRAKHIARALRGDCADFPEGYKGSRTRCELNRLFDACFRIQREASEAVGQHIPLIVENVKGAQPWVGTAKANFGSYYFWGDIGMANGNIVVPDRLEMGAFLRAPARTGGKHNPDGTDHPQGSWFAVADSMNRGALASKNNGGSWFAQAHNTESGHSRNPVNGEGLKVPSIKLSEVGFNVAAAQRYREEQGTKQQLSGREWFTEGLGKVSSRSDSRKAASAMIAKIPFPLAQWIAQVFKPDISPLTSENRDRVWPAQQ